MNAADNFYTTNEGLTLWQVLVVAAFAAAAVVVLDRLWDRAIDRLWDPAIDAYRDWRERRRDDPIEDASDTEPDRRFVPSVPRTVLSEDGTTETPYDPQTEKELT